MCKSGNRLQVDSVRIGYYTAYMKVVYAICIVHCFLCPWGVTEVVARVCSVRALVLISCIKQLPP